LFAPLVRGIFLIELPDAVPMAASASRSVARRIWRGRVKIPSKLGERAAQLGFQTPPTPGRVHSLGRFEDEGVLLALQARLPAAIVSALRPEFEWYGCRGAGFHTDAHYDAVLFGAWLLAGPPRDIAFAEPPLQLSCSPGDAVIFDPFQPHAVLDPGQASYQRDRYLDAAASVFIGFELALSDVVRRQFGIGLAIPGAFSIGSTTPVNAETGQIVR